MNDDDFQGLARAARPPAARGESAQGYMLSSFDLRAALEVKLLAISALPAEVLRELHRLRLCWGPAAALEQAG